MIDHLLGIKTAVDTARLAGQSALPAADLERFLAGYLHIVDTGYEHNPDPELPNGPKRCGCRKQSKARNLLDRFRDHPLMVVCSQQPWFFPRVRIGMGGSKSRPCHSQAATGCQESHAPAGTPVGMAKPRRGARGPRRVRRPRKASNVHGYQQEINPAPLPRRLRHILAISNGNCLAAKFRPVVIIRDNGWAELVP